MKGGVVTEYLATSKHFDSDSTRLWQMRLRHVGFNSLQAKQGLLDCALTCNLEFGKHCVLNKKTMVKFGTVIHHLGGLLDCVHVDVWGLTKTPSIGGHLYYFFC